MLEIARHAVLTVNATGLLCLAVCLAANRAFPKSVKLRDYFRASVLAVVAVKVLYIGVFFAIIPDMVVSSDSNRYFFEMQGIAKAPWKWNPIAGTGPGYSESAKMGMSYLYGVVQYLHGTSSVYGILAINVVVATLACIGVFLLTRELSDSPTPAFMAMAAAAVYPEMLFWNARFLRENLVLCLIPYLFYFALDLKKTHRASSFVYTLLVTAALSLTRAQLAVFLALIVAYFAASTLWQRKRSSYVVTMVLAMCVLAGFGLIGAQVQKASGSALLRYFTIDSVFWIDKLKSAASHLPDLLSCFARQGHGAMGAFIAPAAIPVMLLSALAMFDTRRVFGSHHDAARLLCVCSVVFLVVLASGGLINIRYRSAIAPLLLPLASVTAHHYWKRLGMPSMALSHPQRKPSHG